MKKMKKWLFYSLLFGSCLGWGFSAEAKPLPPVSALTLSAQDQQALLSALPHDVESQTMMVWQGEALQLNLPIHQENRLIFPEPVQVDVNGQLSTDQLRVINDHQAVYLTALTPFPKRTRIYMTLKHSGQIIFFDVDAVKASEKSRTQTIKITVSPTLKSIKKSSEHSEKLPDDTATAVVSGELPPELSPVANTSADELVQAVRFAWQKLYAPAYLLPNDENFMRSPLHSKFWISGLFYSDSVFAHPVASWINNDLTITVVELRNPYPHPVNLNIDRDLCGVWKAAMLYPRAVLQPTGQRSADSATLFLVSHESFTQATEVCHGRI